MVFPYSEKKSPFTLSPESLDAYLAKGWYRMGDHLFTTHFLFFNHRPHSALWLRLDLQDFSFSKSQRKLLRRNAKHFAPAAAPRTIDQEREDLYEIYADNFPGTLSPSIQQNLCDYDDETIFNTYEITVREKSSRRLCALSYFDLGENSVASILGMYHPGQQTFSLGYYTMLLEIEYCLQHGIRYYYPGYVAPGNPRFDYKLRLGDCEYFDLATDNWLPFANLDVAQDGPAEIQLRKLTELRARFPRHNRNRPIVVYALFEAGLYDVWEAAYLPYPYIWIVQESTADNLIVVAFDPRERSYLLISCQHIVQTQLLFNTSYMKALKENNCFADLLVVSRVLLKTDEVGIIAELLPGLW